MAVEELKAETAKLPPDDRFALAEWIEKNDDVRALRREELIRELKLGIDQADRSEAMEDAEDLQDVLAVLENPGTPIPMAEIRKKYEF